MLTRWGRLRTDRRVPSDGPIVAVTGAAGRVGDACLRQLAESSYGVIAIDRQRGHGPGEWRLADLTRTRDARRALAGATHVVHLATRPGPGVGREAEVLADNVAMAANTFEALEPGTGAVVAASSMTVYGLAWAAQVTAPDYLPVDEDHPFRPSDAYSASKVAIEQVAAAWTRRTGRTTVMLRFPWTSGDEPDRIRSFLDEIAGDPLGDKGRRHLWSYVHVADVAAACVASLRVEDGRAHVLNIASNEVIGGGRPGDLAASCFPATVVRRDLEGEGFVSTSRARRLLGWRPQHSLLVDGGGLEGTSAQRG